MNKKRILVFLFSFLGVSVFAQTTDMNAYTITFPEVKSTNSNSSNTSPEKSTLEPTFPLSYNVQVVKAMDTIIANNKNIKKAKGYRIAVYNGENKEEIKKVKEFVYALYPTINIISEYKQPVYKIKVGDFMTRYEAFEVLAQINTQYPDALIVPEIVDINPPTLDE